MNIELDRRVFIGWHFNKYYAKDADKEFLYEMFEDKNEFISYEVQHSWVAWQASANREGYKFVPVGLIERCISHIGIASCHPANSLEDDRKMDADIDALEKAMIGACDE